MEVPSLLYRFIIGKRGDTKRKIEKETGTQIMIPRQGEEGEVGEFCRAWLSIFKSLSTYLRCTVMLSFSIFSHGCSMVFLIWSVTIQMLSVINLYNVHSLAHFLVHSESIEG